MKNINDFNSYIEAMAANQAKSAELYGAYLNGMATRASEAFTSMGEDARSHFEQMSKMSSLTDAFQAGAAYDSNVRGKLKELYDNNVDATKTLATEIASVYTPDAAAKSA